MSAMATMPRARSHSGSEPSLRQLLGRRATSRTTRPAAPACAASPSSGDHQGLPQCLQASVTICPADDGPEVRKDVGGGKSMEERPNLVGRRTFSPQTLRKKQLMKTR